MGFMDNSHLLSSIEEIESKKGMGSTREISKEIFLVGRGASRHKDSTSVCPDSI